MNEGLLRRDARTVLRLWLCAILAVCCGLAASPAGAAAPPAEQRLIEALIAEVEQMQDIVFIRNGSEHNNVDAAKHLRDKYNYFRNDIQTADDFIRLCATRSELSGLPYKVRDASGRVTEAGPFLSAHLAALRAQAAQAAAPAAPAPAGAGPTPAR